MSRPVFVLYVPGLDHRLLDPAVTPRICEILAEHPPVVLRTIPSTELLPTIITGVPPEKHGMWQVSLDERPDDWKQRLANLIPDFVSTTAQCIGHFVDRKTFDLAAIPWRRRRHLQPHRLSYDRRLAGILDIRSGVKTLFHAVPGALYEFQKSFKSADDVLARHPVPNAPIDFLQFHAFDVFLHWNIDRPDKVEERLRSTDAFVGALRDKCARRDVTMMFLVDHGQTLIEKRIDFRKILKGTGVSETEYHYFLEITLARLWFRNEMARARIEPVLRETPGIQVYNRKEYAQFDVRFEEREFGDLFIMADHGLAFFPHDFHHPIGNFVVGLTEERARITNPKHRGNHGQNTDHPSEEGYITVIERGWQRNRERGKLVDVLPTILAVIDHEFPKHLAGEALFSLPLVCTEPVSNLE